jgi:hypothetical protein
MCLSCCSVETFPSFKIKLNATNFQTLRMYISVIQNKIKYCQFSDPREVYFRHHEFVGEEVTASHMEPLVNLKDSRKKWSSVSKRCEFPSPMGGRRLLLH